MFFLDIYINLFLTYLDAEYFESGEFIGEIEDKIEADYKKKISKRSHRWKPVEYDSEAAWSYFIGTKAAYDFATLKTVFNEIRKRDQKFKPNTLFDFGSGVGTVTW